MSTTVSAGTLYEMNQQIFKQMKLPSKQKLGRDLASVGAWFSSKPMSKYYMLLCKERSDYTIFHFESFNFSKATEELKEVLEERGDIMGFDFDHDAQAYQCWVRERSEDPEVYMFMLFDADWMIVNI